MKKSWVLVNSIPLLYTNFYWCGGDYFAVVDGNKTYFFAREIYNNLIKDFKLLEEIFKDL